VFVLSLNQLLLTGTQLVVYDNVVQGVLPSFNSISAATGLSYYTELQAYTRGYPRGYSNYSVPVAVAVASRLTLQTMSGPFT